MLPAFISHSSWLILQMVMMMKSIPPVNFPAFIPCLVDAFLTAAAMTTEAFFDPSLAARKST